MKIFEKKRKTKKKKRKHLLNNLLARVVVTPKNPKCLSFPFSYKYAQLKMSEP